MKYLLLLDSKKVFIYLCAIPFIISFGLTFIFNEFTFIDKLIFDSLSFVFVSFIFFWYWTIGRELNNILQSTTKFQSTLFNISWILIEITLIVDFINSYLLHFNIIYFIAIVFFATLLLFYNWYYISRLILNSDISLEIKFIDYVKLILGLWVFPVGIWWIQPKIQKIFRKMPAANTV